MNGGSPYYKRGRGDRSAIDSESLLGCAVVTPLLNVALCICVRFLSIFLREGEFPAVTQVTQAMHHAMLQCCNAVIMRCLQYYSMRCLRLQDRK